MAATPGVDRERPSLLRTMAAKPIAVLLVLMMAVGSVVLWIGIPVGWVWVASRTVKTSQPSFGPYLLVLVATPVTMWLWAKLLFRLNDLYSRVTGQTHEVRTQLPWHKSMRGERASNRPTTVLDLVMMVSVSLALTAFGIWFFFFAGSSIPNL
ncbi:MAG TPA: hypothetical protein VGC71_03560 [Gaiellales bacterium]